MVTLQTQIHWDNFKLDQWLKSQHHITELFEDVLGQSPVDFFMSISDIKKICIIETISLVTNFSKDDELVLCCLYSEYPEIVKISELKSSYQNVLSQYHQLEKALKLIKSSNEHIKENTRKMLIALVDDPRLVVLLLCHVLCYLRHKDLFAEEQIKNLARATLEIFAPISHRLGIGQVKWEMEDLAFRVLHLDDYKSLSTELAQSRVQREQYVDTVKTDVTELLKQQGVNASISGRPKHFYSIWRKMTRKSKSLAQIHDLHAIRILVDDQPQCYRALGAIHTKWRYLPEEFDDYIANPKINGYQSIHTAVIGPNNRVIEVQIRTHQMHLKAELGIAAHWVYKDNKKHELSYQQKLETLRGLLSRSENSSAEVFENVKEEIFGDRKYVFTPKGDVFDLPTGATGLDLAYLIHTDIGHKCSGVKVNSKIQPLSTPLKNGDVVEILTLNKQGPSRDWLNPSYGYIATARARQKVSHWFRSLDKDKLVHEGKVYLEKEFKKVGLQFKDLQEKVLEKIKIKDKDELLFLVATGELKISKILDKLESQSHAKKESRNSKEVSHLSQKAGEVFFHQVQGRDIKYALANCCIPNFCDPIVGVINRGAGINVHKSDCPNLKSIPHIQERLLGAYWSGQEDIIEEMDATILEVLAVNREGLVNEITAILLRYSVAIDDLSTNTNKENHTAKVTVAFKDKGYSMLHHLIDQILQLTSVISVEKI